MSLPTQRARHARACHQAFQIPLPLAARGCLGSYLPPRRQDCPEKGAVLGMSACSGWHCHAWPWSAARQCYEGGEQRRRAVEGSALAGIDIFESCAFCFRSSPLQSEQGRVGAAGGVQKRGESRQALTQPALFHAGMSLPSPPVPQQRRCTCWLRRDGPRCTCISRTNHRAARRAWRASAACLAPLAEGSALHQHWTLAPSLPAALPAFPAPRDRLRAMEPAQDAPSSPPGCPGTTRNIGPSAQAPLRLPGQSRLPLPTAACSARSPPDQSRTLQPSYLALTSTGMQLDEQEEEEASEGGWEQRGPASLLRLAEERVLRGIGKKSRRLAAPFCVGGSLGKLPVHLAVKPAAGAAGATVLCFPDGGQEALAQLMGACIPASFGKGAEEGGWPPDLLVSAACTGHCIAVPSWLLSACAVCRLSPRCPSPQRSPSLPQPACSAG